ncbi:MAG: ferrous iron transporter B, partial [Lachnospiraceae bacterium]|nr:ferrous iron transporter B [Lachnospiraceae bacterium]
KVIQLLWENAKDFLQLAFTIIFLATVIVWFLQSFDLRLNMTDQPQESILSLVAGVIEPLFIPLGFGDWRISTALISGFMAKESVVSTLSVLLPAEEGIYGLLTKAGAFSLLVFCLLYTPCVAAVAAVKRELGTKWAGAVAAGQCLLAWVVSFVVYQLLLLVGMQ